MFRKFAAVAAIATILALLSTPLASAKPGPEPDQIPYPHRPCKTEDSAYCVWDAIHLGNGHGRSYWVGPKPTMYKHFVSHRFAHTLIWGDKQRRIGARLDSRLDQAIHPRNWQRCLIHYGDTTRILCPNGRRFTS